MSLVGFAKIRRNTVDSLKKAIQESLDLIGYSFAEDKKNIVIKPNLCYYWDLTTGQTTDPKSVAALIELIYEKTSSSTEITIVESDASAMKCKHVFKMLGYEKLAKDYGVNLVNLSEDEGDVVGVSVGDEVLKLKIPRTIQNADLKINVPKVKYTFGKIKITCALKNIFGCNPYPKKFRYHPKLEEAIVAINKAMKFDLCIIDGNVVSGIEPRRLGLVMASKDPVAIDVAAAKIAGINARTVKYIQLANKEGLGNNHFIPKGMPISHFIAGYPRKNLQKKFMSKAYSLVTHIGLGKRLGLG